MLPQHPVLRSLHRYGMMAWAQLDHVQIEHVSCLEVAHRAESVNLWTVAAAQIVRSVLHELQCQHAGCQYLPTRCWAGGPLLLRLHQTWRPVVDAQALVPWMQLAMSSRVPEARAAQWPEDLAWKPGVRRAERGPRVGHAMQA